MLGTPASDVHRESRRPIHGGRAVNARLLLEMGSQTRQRPCRERVPQVSRWSHRCVRNTSRCSGFSRADDRVHPSPDHARLRCPAPGTQPPTANRGRVNPKLVAYRTAYRPVANQQGLLCTHHEHPLPASRGSRGERLRSVSVKPEKNWSRHEPHCTAPRRYVATIRRVYLDAARYATRPPAPGCTRPARVHLSHILGRRRAELALSDASPSDRGLREPRDGAVDIVAESPGAAGAGGRSRPRT